ncbi:hypothetical protein BAE44_0012478 [Dichanthelium oligosanthes]|uniref:NB-ARC domain-containing protein n=1 Tax=Dichanthelium oligosanthes TaxID=888268 RepID=A0A1E5VN70_9POAL|nr:hypothetical protein BAE44_0012478 [Dichanthelium oligosanthes]
MAEQVESKQPAPGDEAEQLKSRVERLCIAIDKEADSDLAGWDDLGKICEVLKEIKGKMITPIKDDDDKKDDDDGKKDGDDQQRLPKSKWEELSKLLPHIEHALEQCKQPGRRRQEPTEAEHPAVGKKLLSAVGCNPCRPWPSQQQQQSKQQQEDDEAVSLKLLLRLTQNVLEPEQYYEWTTSYVDESRIYGWDTEADEVAGALVAPEGDGGSLFRAAGIAGVHGSGKTALAQKVFVHDKAKDNFAIRLWVCVGPPDSEDRFSLLYRMLDNLGLDTAKVEDIVANSNVVREATKKQVDRIRNDTTKFTDIQKEAAEKTRVQQADAQKQHKEEADKKEEGAVTAKDVAGGQDDSIINQLIKEKADESLDVKKSKYGVLLYILHMTLSKTSYMIVFDDIRAYGDDGWYSNLTLLPPPEGEWGDRLAYGLPKGSHRGAVLVTCRNEDDARSMVRTGRVVRPPRLELDDAWKLFRREYDQAKDAKRKKDEGKGDGGKGEDMLLKELEEMKEQIVNKCLGLPVAIAEAAKGFAVLEPLPPEEANKPAVVADLQTASSSNKDVQAAGGESN